MEIAQTLSHLKMVILSHWENLVRESIKESKNVDSVILLDHMPGMIDQLIGIMECGIVDEVELGKSHGFQRAILTKFSLGDILNEYSLLRETIIDYLYPMGDISCARLVHKYIDLVCKHAVVEFINDNPLMDAFKREDMGSEIKDLKNNPNLSPTADH